MYTRYKFLMLLAFCLVGMIATSFLVAVGDRMDGFSLSMVASFLVLLVISVIAINGYADSKALANKGRVTGMTLDQMAAVYGIKRRRSGWEFDSKLSDRLGRKIAGKMFGSAKSVTIYDREI